MSINVAKAARLVCKRNASYVGGSNFKSVLLLVEPLSDKIWPNCAFYDTSMKFGSHLEYIITKIFGYRAISDFALDGVGSYFKDGCRKPTKLSKDFCNVDQMFLNQNIQLLGQ